MIKSTYEKLKKKFSLPDYDSVNKELEISDIESEDFLLRKIMAKIVERIDTAAELIGSLLQPSADSLIDMHECRFFGDKEKKKMIEVYKKLMIIKRGTIEAELSREDKDEAEVVKEFFKEFPALKKEIIPVVRKLKTCWEKETEIEEKLEYFG